MKKNSKKNLLKIFSLVIMFYICGPLATACVVGSDFVKCSEQQVLKHMSYTHKNFKITVNNNTLVAIPYIDENPLVSELLVDKGVFEGIDCGEWGGAVRFLPNNPKDYIKVPRVCPLCGSKANCNCPFSKLPVEENVFKGVFENVDSLEYRGISMYIFLPLRDISRISVLNKNCRGFFKIGDRCFAITGLDHLGEESGKIYELVVTSNTCTATQIVNIGSCPEVFMPSENIVYVATKTSLLAFNGNQLNALIDFKFDFQPNSIVYADDCLFTATMEGFVNKYNLVTKEVEWYRYVGKNI